jgi:hypothetical protein
MRKYLIIFALSLWLVPVFAIQAHPRTDKYSCHTCRTNCAKWNLKPGQYHCHPKLAGKVNTKKLCTIKGDIVKVGNKTVRKYYQKTSNKYSNITIKPSQGDRLFCSVSAAKKAGFIRAK